MAKKDKGGKKQKDGRADTDAEAQAPEVFGALAQAARSSRTALSRHLTASGLYAGQDAVMLALDAEDGQSLSAIAAHLGVRAPTITKTINRLAAQGFVAKRGSESDGRRAHVHLTDAGRAAIEAVRAAVSQSEAEALSGFSGKQVRTLHKLLRKLDANLQRAASLSPGHSPGQSDARPIPIGEGGLAGGDGAGGPD